MPPFAQLNEKGGLSVVEKIVGGKICERISPGSYLAFVVLIFALFSMEIRHAITNPVWKCKTCTFRDKILL